MFISCLGFSELLRFMGGCLLLFLKNSLILNLQIIPLLCSLSLLSFWNSKYTYVTLILFYRSWIICSFFFNHSSSLCYIFNNFYGPFLELTDSFLGCAMSIDQPLSRFPGHFPVVLAFSSSRELQTVWIYDCFLHLPQKDRYFFFSLSLATWCLHLAQSNRVDGWELLLVPSGLGFFHGREKGPHGALYFLAVTVTFLLQVNFWGANVSLF